MFAVLLYDKTDSSNWKICKIQQHIQSRFGWDISYFNSFHDTVWIETSCLAFCLDPITLQVYSLFNAVHTYVLKQQCSVRYQHQKVGMQFVSITIDMLQIPEKLLLHRILSSCAKRICVARCLKLSLILLSFHQKTGRISLQKNCETDWNTFQSVPQFLLYLPYFVMSTILKGILQEIIL